VKGPFDHPPLCLGDTGRIQNRILLTSVCKNDAQTLLPKGLPFFSAC
jgi:hypothetical protein